MPTRGPYRVRALLPLSLLALSCQSQPSGGGAEASAAASAAAATSAAAAGPSAAAVQEGEARGLLDKWLAAQNQGDFDGYQALYAAKLEGVKRTGTQTSRFSRKGWMADRRRMFERKMVVEASDVEVAASASGARVHFTQSWSSGTFQDRGPKELVLVREEGALKIAREEMLRSSKSKTELPPLDGSKFAWIVHAKLPRVVIDAQPPEGLLVGPSRLASMGSPVVSEAPLIEKGIPASAAAWRGRELRLFGEGGEVCRAKVGKLMMVSRMEPHFGAREAWKESPPPAADPPGTVQEARMLAAGGFGPGDNGVILVGDLEAAGGDCSKALWARDASLDVPAVADGKPAAPELRSAALEAFRKLPEYGKTAADYAKAQVPHAAHWDEHHKDRPAEVQEFRLAGGPTFAVVSANIGEGCDSAVYGSLAAVFQAEGDPSKPRLVLASEPQAAWMPRTAADVDGDGKVEFLSPETILRARGTALNQFELLRYPFFDCSC